jgi:hypothetical protein
MIFIIKYLNNLHFPIHNTGIYSCGNPIKIELISVIKIKLLLYITIYK